MKKLFMLLAMVFAVSTLAACDFMNSEDVPEEYQNKRLFEGCNGDADYVIIDGICYPMNDIVSQNIQINGSEVRVDYNNSIELMDNFVADLTDSAGLAVVDRDMYDRQANTRQSAAANDDQEEPEDETENVIVKLTQDGFFEEVSFTDDYGFQVEVTANPLALEVYGDFTVVIFEVNHGYEDPNQDFNSKVWDSFWSGGIYLIHNETGKLFATKEVNYNEDTWTDVEYYNREVVTMVTLNQPVTETIFKDILDENGKAILDDEGNPTFEEIVNELKDSEGNPIIFTEGPVLTETTEVPLVEYFEVEVLDDEGNNVLDDEGKPVVEVISEPVLDENGNPIVEVQEVPVLDENGNPVMKETFEVRFTVEERIEVEHTSYWAEVNDNPLTPLAERFIQKIMEEYYNWNYYRVNEYVLHDYNFTYSNEFIYYNEFTHNADNTSSRMVKKMYFDDVTSEIVIENYMDIELAGFNECNLFVEPVNGSIICNPWDGNVKIFSSTHGLKTIEDSENLQAIVLPNGELYFMDNNPTWVDELGYNTVMLHTINLDGTLNSNYVELGESDQICVGDCQQYFNVNFTDYDDEDWRSSRHMSFNFPNNSKYVESADATLVTLGEFESERPVCEDANGCWYNQETRVVDEDGVIIARNWHSGTYYPEDTPPSYTKTYLFGSSAEVVNRREYSTEVKVCENNELGCTDDIYLRDTSIGNDGIWVWGRFLIDGGDNFIDNIQMNEDNNALYEYTKTTNGEVCDNEDGCSEWIQVKYYEEDELVATTNTEYSVLNGETMPLFIEYNTSSDSVVTYKTEICNNAGCSELVEINEEFSFWKYYENGEVMLDSIDYAETDRSVVLTDTEERELCTEINGCHFSDVTYIVLDTDGNPLYTFEVGLHVEYGYKAPFKVEVSIDECSINNQNVWSEEDKVCDETTCTEWFNVYKGDQNNHLAGGEMTYSEGETIIDSIILPSDSLQSESFENICTETQGCYMSTENFKFLLEDGTDVTFDYSQHGWNDNVEVFFEYGSLLPLDNQFYAEYELTNMEYATYRMNSWEFRDGLNNMVRLEENLYLLEKNSWNQGEYNYILSFDETVGRYKVKYTNMSTVLEVTTFNDSFIAVNEDKTAIFQYTYNPELSDDNMYYFDELNLTDGLELNGVSDLIVDYDGSIYFKGVDNFLNTITGSIDEFGVISIDTEYIEPVIVRVRPIN